MLLTMVLSCANLSCANFRARCLHTGLSCACLRPSWAQVGSCSAELNAAKFDPVSFWLGQVGRFFQFRPIPWLPVAEGLEYGSILNVPQSWLVFIRVTCQSCQLAPSEGPCQLSFGPVPFCPAAASYSQFPICHKMDFGEANWRIL